jgi:hypothetical protein
MKSVTRGMEPKRNKLQMKKAATEAATLGAPFNS